MAEAENPAERDVPSKSDERPDTTEGWTRHRVEARLDAVVTEHRFTIAVVFPVVGAVLLTASAADLLPGWLAFNPLAILLGTLVMRSPLASALAPLLDRRAVIALALTDWGSDGGGAEGADLSLRVAPDLRGPGAVATLEGRF